MEINIILRIGGDFGDSREEELGLLEDIRKHGDLEELFYFICLFVVCFSIFIVINNYYCQMSFRSGLSIICTL